MAVILGYTQPMHLPKNNNGKLKWEYYLDPYVAINFGATVIRRSIFDQVGLFNENLSLAEDVDWFLRAKEVGALIMIHKKVILLYRRHESNLTNQQKITQSYFLKTVKKSIDRRRVSKDGTVASLPKWFSKYKS